MLIVDASQGIEAQTISNLYLALGNDLEIIPVLNKIDLPGAHARGGERTKLLICSGVSVRKSFMPAGKEGIGIQDILEAIVARVAAPQRRPARRPLRGTDI